MGVFAIGAGAGCAGFRRPSAAARPTGRSPVVFEERAESLNLRYSWGPRHKTPLDNLDTFGAGCAFADLNRDGRLDIVAVGEPGIRVFLAGSDGFTDVSARFHLTSYTGHWTGIAVGDYDGDGWPDLLITGYRKLLLLQNLRGAGFADRTSEAGLDPTNWRSWGSSAGFADLDGDGDLDLVLMNYVLMGPNSPHFCEIAAGIKSGCSPQTYEPDYSRIYRNDHGHFVDVTVSSHANTTHGKGLALAFCDYDNDGRADIYMGNDGTPSDLLKCLPGFRFRNVGLESGAAFGTMGQPTAAMGAAWGDFDRDGQFDLAASAFSNEEYSLLRQDHGRFIPVSAAVGMALPTFKPLGFGTLFLDADNDGRLDLHFVNGHVYDNVRLIDPTSSYAEPMMLFHQQPDGTVKDLAPICGAGFNTPIVGRGSAVGDYDGDGRQDLLVVDLEGRLRLYHNESPFRHWLTVHLEGAQPGNRLAYGARLEVEPAGQPIQIREVFPACSYLSSSDPDVHVGLGDAAGTVNLKVRWPSGHTQTAAGISVDRAWTWREGGAPGEPLPRGALRN